MAFTNDRRKSKGTARSRALYALLALWVGLGIQPCAVAAVSDSDCPHCPPTEESLVSPEDEHCGGADPTLNASAPSECCDADDGAIDSRSSTVDQKDLHDVVDVPVLGFSVAWPLPTIARFMIVDPPDRHRSVIPLFIKHCVYRI